jgi:tetratricopeptide (TPR) repeat protein
MKVANILTLQLLFILLIGCSKPSEIEPQLLQIDNLISNYPDSAYHLISNIDTTKLKSKFDYALYFLLQTQATDKIGIDQYNDSLINIAKEYFDNSNKPRYEMLTNYYAGIINYNSGNYGKGISNLLHAEDIAKNINDKFHLGLIYRSMCDIYKEILSTQQQIKYARLAYKYFSDIHAQRYSDFAFMEIGQAYYMADQYDLARKYYNIGFNKAKQESDTILMIEYLHRYEFLYNAKRDYHAAVSCFHVINDLDKSQITSDDYKCLATAYAELGQTDSARYIYNYAPLAPDAKIWVGFRLANNSISNDSMIVYLNNVIDLQDNAICNLSNEQVNSSATNYYNGKLSEHKLELKHNRLLYFIITLILFIIIVIITCFYVVSNLKKRQIISYYITTANEYKGHIDTIVTELNHNKELLTQYNTDFEAVRNDILDMIHGKFDSINHICDSFYNSTDSALDKTLVYKQISLILKSFKKETASKEVEYEAIINKYMDNLVSRFKEQMPQLKQSDYSLILYLAMGLSTKAICILSSCTTYALYTRKFRLKEKISSAKPRDAQLFMKVLS